MSERIRRSYDNVLYKSKYTLLYYTHSATVYTVAALHRVVKKSNSYMHHRK